MGKTFQFCTLFITGWVVLFSCSVIVKASGWGTITGQLVLEGEIPKLEPLIKKGNRKFKDAAICAMNDIKDESLVVDSKSKGIANVFIYMKETKNIHPTLIKSKKKEVRIKEKGCNYIPHTMIVRSDQSVRVINEDSCFHNIHTFPTNTGSLINDRPRDKKGFLIKNLKSGKLPMEVKCDIHAWMNAYWLIVNHPYAVVTDAKGKFKIENVPEGKQKFRVWQEESGFISFDSKNTTKTSRGFEVEINIGKTLDLGKIKIPVKEFQ